MIIAETCRDGIIVDTPRRIAVGAGARPAAGLVDRQDHDPGIVAQRDLHAVAMMGVDIQIGDPRRAPVEGGEDAEHRVVEKAEAARTVLQAVMGAAGRAEHDAALFQQFDGVQCRARRGRRAPEDLAEHRIAVDAEIVARALFFGRRPVALALPDGGDIVRVVEPGELFFGRNRALDILFRRQPAQGAAQIDGERDPRDRQRMFPAVAGMPVDLAGDEAGLGHDAGEIARPAGRSSPEAP